MKTLLTIFASVACSASLIAQAPQKMTYQAVVRNSSNALVQNSTIGMKVTLLQGSATGTVVYVETHAPRTNENGLLNIEIGGGKVDTGTYQNGIFWGGGPYFLKTEIDPMGSANYTITATSELLSVPYSNYAHVSGVSGALFGVSWKFVGAYIQVNQDSSDQQIEGYCFINYLGADKLSFTFKEIPTDYNGDGRIESDEFSPTYTLFGTVVGNIITFPLQNNISEDPLTGTLIGDSLTITDGYNIAVKLVKQ